MGKRLASDPLIDSPLPVPYTRLMSVRSDPGEIRQEIGLYAGNGIERNGHFKNPETVERTLPNGNRVDENGWEHYTGTPRKPACLRRWRDR